MFGSLIAGMVIGAILVAYNFSIQKHAGADALQNLSFTDFIGALLACIALIMTIFGVFLALMAVYGFAAIQERGRSSAQEAAKSAVENSLQEGGTLYTLTKKTIEEITYRGVGMDESSGRLDPRE